jgi:hypothetical protein
MNIDELKRLEPALHARLLRAADNDVTQAAELWSIADQRVAVLTLSQAHTYVGLLENAKQVEARGLSATESARMNMQAMREAWAAPLVNGWLADASRASQQRQGRK